MENLIEDQQHLVCQRYGAGFRAADLDKVIGVADNVLEGSLPLNGLRHPVEESMTGWYIWAGGEPSTAPNFFKPMHLEHLLNIRPEVLKYLGLAPGWRFLIDPSKDYEDVWRDNSLLVDD